jgi:hypothetical protein
VNSIFNNKIIEHIFLLKVELDEQNMMIPAIQYKQKLIKEELVKKK